MNIKDVISITSIAQYSRATVEDLKSVNGMDVSRHSCLYACLLLHSMVKNYTELTVTICGGDGEGDGGLFLDGEGHEHYWVEVSDPLDPPQSYIIDIGADKFLLPKTMVFKNNAPNSWLDYRRGDQQAVDRHVLEVAQGMR